MLFRSNLFTIFNKKEYSTNHDIDIINRVKYESLTSEFNLDNKKIDKKVTIVCLIYKSIEFSDWVWESAHKYTEELKNGQADFLFVLNNGTDELREHLIKKNYNFVEVFYDIKSDEDLFKLGIGSPEYLHRVYKSWNFGIKNATHDIVCLVNSDMFFSEGWLTNLVKRLNDNTVVSSKLVEPENKHSVFVNR